MDDFETNSNSNSNSSTSTTATSYAIRNRLQHARKIIRDVTNQTLKSIDSKSTIIQKEDTRNNESNESSENNENSPSTSCSNTSHGEKENKKNNDANSCCILQMTDKEELDLAMALFGDSNLTAASVPTSTSANTHAITSSSSSFSSRKHNHNHNHNHDHDDHHNNGHLPSQSYFINREIHEKLSLIESQLSTYDDHDDNLDANKMQVDHDNNSNNEIDFSSLVVTSSSSAALLSPISTTASPPKASSSSSKALLQTALEQETTELKSKISFLQSCTEARIALDDIDAYTIMNDVNFKTSFDTTTTTTTATTRSNDAYASAHAAGIGSDGHSPTSTISSSSNPSHVVLISIAKCISQAQESIQTAKQYLTQKKFIANTTAAQQNDIHVAHQIIDSIEIHIIRQICDLEAKISSIVDSCVQITNSSIYIHVEKVSSSQHASSSASSSNEDNSSGMMKTVLQVLEILSEPHFISKSDNDDDDKLSTMISTIGHELKQKIIKPKLMEIRAQMHTCNNNNKDKKNMIMKPITFKESTSYGYGNMTGSGRGIVRGGKKNYLTLEWNHNEQNEQNDNINDVHNDDHNDNTPASFQWWSELLDFIQSICTFVNRTLFPNNNDRHKELSMILGKTLLLEEDMIRCFMRNVTGTNRRSSATYDPIMAKYAKHDIYDSGSVMKVLIDLLEDECIPNTITTSVLTQLSSLSTLIIQKSTSFEQAMMEQNLLPREYKYIATTESMIGNQRTQLTVSAKSYMDTFTQKQRTRVLSHGRKLLLDEDFHDTMQVGVNVYEKQKAKRPNYLDYMIDFPNDTDDMSIFVLHEQKISIVASKLMQYCIETMDEAINTDFSIVGSSSNISEDDEDVLRSKALNLKQLMPFMLYRSARELFDLYRAIIPATHGHEVATIPRTAAILHNDCVYFAHKMLSLGLEYKDQFSSLKTGKDGTVRGNNKDDNIASMNCTFIDLVPIFRELAERTMNDMIKYQMNQLSEVVHPRIIYLKDALRENEGVVEWTDAETALQAGLYHLRHLSQSWWSTLSYDVYSRTMANLVDSLFSIYLEEVLKATDISEPACRFLSALFRDAVRGTAELFAIKQDFEESLREARKYCKSWKKFHAVGEFMDMSIADINVNLSEGTFREVTGVELSRLVTAVYEDSDKRRQLLNLLANH